MADLTECMKETESRAELIPPPCLRFVECRLTFGALLEFMASAWRLCKVIVLLLLEERMKGSQTAELRLSSEVCFSCRQMAQTEDASARCRQRVARGLLSRLEFRCLQAGTVDSQGIILSLQACHVKPWFLNMHRQGLGRTAGPINSPPTELHQLHSFVP
ncbi:hypothetical protein Q8A67_018358 [Cirrhinus molitorella]|uniref:Uncharacterized protein n=1 Tax=Cirrhinus molitorella TaxID=172907 RepID=A0AA88PBY1_9TELE|nr:hypothetical protein Q8A67_018358 [Cirrhinus molitorella]